MRARASTSGWNCGCVVTSCTRSPLIQTSRPSRSDARYSSPVRIIGSASSRGLCLGTNEESSANWAPSPPGSRTGGGGPSAARVPEPDGGGGGGVDAVGKTSFAACSVALFPFAWQSDGMVAATSEGLERASAERRARWLRQRRRRRVFWLVVAIALLAAGLGLLWSARRHVHVRAPGGAIGGADTAHARAAAAGARHLAPRPARRAAGGRRRDAREPGAAHGRPDLRRRAVGAHGCDPARPGAPPRARHVLRSRARHARHGARPAPHRGHGKRARRPHLQPCRSAGAARARAAAPAAVDARARLRARPACSRASSGRPTGPRGPRSTVSAAASA